MWTAPGYSQTAMAGALNCTRCHQGSALGFSTSRTRSVATMFSRGASPSEKASRSEGEAGGTTKQYAVAGMTCGHCVGAVTQELAGLEGVEGVDVTLVADGTSTVTVTSSRPVSDEAVAAAIHGAGYTVITAIV